MRRFPWSVLLRAGTFGALHGGHPGFPALGLTVPARTRAELQAALSALAQAQVKATLLCPSRLASEAPDLLTAATRAGHEIAGTGRVSELAWLQAVAGQRVTAWSRNPPAEEGELGGAELRQLAAWGMRPLPIAQPLPQPGGTVQVDVADLPQRVAEWRGNGYQLLPVRDLPGLRTAAPFDLFHHVYARLVEDRFTAQHHLIELTDRPDGLMRVAALDHAPAPLPLPRQTPTAELHLNSARLVGLADRNKLATYRAYQRSLSDVAQALQTRPELADARAVFAVTLFHGPLEKAGFAPLDLPPLQARWYGLGFRLLRMAYGTLRPPSDGLPRMAWMERGAFLERYGQGKR